MTSDTKTAIMDATHRALCEHGYADLTMQDIADECDCSTAALHYHYDTKQALLVAFLDHLFERFTDRIPDPEDGDASERLRALLEEVLGRGEATTATERRRFRTATLEIKAQAPYEQPFRERLARFDEELQSRFRSILADGIETGHVRADVDPAVVADFLVTAVNGAYTRQVAVEHDPTATDAHVRQYLASTVLTDASDVDVQPSGEADSETPAADRTGGTSA